VTTPRIPKSAIEASLSGVEELEFLDRGGQGDAWRAVIEGQEQVVKVIVAASEPKRIDLEVASLQAIDSPHVMGYIGSGLVNYEGKVYPLIRGEYIAGGTVRTALAKGRPTPAEVGSCGATAAIGLREIHNAGRIHRDVKPSNLGLRNGAWNEAVILDLGMVRDLIGDSITVYPRLIGTVPYMAPEQVRQERAVKKSDVFGLGVVLFEAIAEQHPFFRDDNEELTLEEFHGRMESADWPDWDLIGAHSTVAEDALRAMMAFEPYDRPKAKRVIELMEQIG
jgi:eukaryotic-like serine/threonine-protein kinase